MFKRLRALCTEEVDRTAAQIEVINKLRGSGYPASLIRRQLRRMFVPVAKPKREWLGTAVIPYKPGTSETIRRILNTVNISVGFQRGNTLRSALVQLKYRLPANRTRDCVYKIKCSDCIKVYIGQTARELHTRIVEHKRKINKPPRNVDEYRALLKDSAIAEHVLDTGHKIDLENVEVLRRGLRSTSVENGLGSVELTRVGIQDVSGLLVRDFTGSATAFAYLLVSISSVCTALCFAELSTLIPRAGSLYTYAYVTLGECAAFWTGWIMVSQLITSTAATAKSFSRVINYISNNTILLWSKSNLYNIENSDIMEHTPDLVAILSVIVVILVVLSGAYSTVSIAGILSCLTIIILIVLSISCFVLGDIDNFMETNGFLPYGFERFLEGCALLLFAGSGFETLATASEEAVDPRRDLPIALVLGILICTMVNLLLAFGIAYIAPHSKLTESFPLIHAFRLTKEPSFAIVAVLGSVMTGGPSKLVAVYSVSRLLYAISSDGLLFPFLATTGPRFNTPIWSVFVVGIILLAISGFFQLTLVFRVGALTVSFVYLLIGIQSLVFRYLLDEDLTAIEVDNEADQKALPVPKLPTAAHKTPICPLRINTPTVLTHLGYKSWFKGILTAFVLLVLLYGVGLQTIPKYKNGVVWIISGIFVPLILVTFGLIALYRPNKFYGTFQVARCLVDG
ncbi:cationic amino acid transporter 3 [Clonorchis sinensis]|uniref:Cationic amino acid transporter 3 n=1 Tax=Clonorchis sinensis TaxID=79923 RepID=G7YS90_CLOSI|nr:cationic amino acid transporter 3 [Clonorchis sinensis]